MRGKAIKGICSLFTSLSLLASLSVSFAATAADIGTSCDDTAAYIQKTVPNPQVGSIGGEWAILGLARSGCKVDGSYYDTYYKNVESYVKACEGKLSDKKYTDYSRLAIALSSIGVSPLNVAGYNLLSPLGDYDKTVWQGINGPIYALIALDCGNYSMPINSSAAVQATRDLYVKKILSLQLSDGGFALSGASADPDVTAMALQALSKYQSKTEVSSATEKALNSLSKLQNGTGGFSSGGSAYSESVSQAIAALGELNISLADIRFVKNGNSLMDALLTYHINGGGFKHSKDDSSADEMSTEQALYALASAKRNINGEVSLYNMSDALQLISSDDSKLKAGEGLAGKNADVKAQTIIDSGRTFSDISGKDADKYASAIADLSSRGIIGGYEDGTFKPFNSMTRAEFAAIIVRSLGLIPKNTDSFSDVISSIWYAPFVGTANSYGIVKGKTISSFDPSGTITRQEASVMVARAAALCGMNTTLTSSEVRDVLAQFGDYNEVASWSQESVAFCYSTDISDKSALDIQPTAAITRGEITQMLYNMLGCANLR